MFIIFWVLSPLAGILLLTLSQTAYLLFSSLTVFNIYQYITYRSFEWPYFAKTPHWSATLLLLMNIAFWVFFFGRLLSVAFLVDTFVMFGMPAVATTLFFLQRPSLTIRVMNFLVLSKIFLQEEFCSPRFQLTKPRLEIVECWF